MRDINVRYFKKLYVDISDISGQGLFAGEKIAKGEIILSFGGTLALQADRYSGKYMSSTFVGISETVMLCETSDAEKDFSDYINHSCNPNAGMLDCLSVVAVRDINEHEEIVCDYAFWEANEKWVLKKTCNCGSSNCRRSISGKDWKKVKPEDDNFEFFSPYIKRRIIKYAERS